MVPSPRIVAALGNFLAFVWGSASKAVEVLAPGGGAWSEAHRLKTFKLPNDPRLAGNVQDVVGLYVDPPDHALVLSVVAPAIYSGQ